MGVIDPAGGQREKIHTYFDEFLKNKYYNLENESLSFNDFYAMSERYFKYQGVPVLYRDIIYNLLGYFFAIAESPDDSLIFYSRLIKDNNNYMKRKEDIQYYLDRGCDPDCIDVADYLYAPR